jgi:hypothetical protein
MKSENVSLAVVMNRRLSGYLSVYCSRGCTVTSICVTNIILFYNLRIMVDAVEEMTRQEIINMINTVNENTRYKK